MSRSRVTLLVALMVGALALTTTVAQAQTYPGTSVPTSSTSSTTATTVTPTNPTTPTIPPTNPTNPTSPTVTPTTAPPTGPVCTTPPTSPNLLLPGATVSLVVTCNLIIGGDPHSGTGASTPFALPSTVASPGQVTFRVTLPGDFQLNATHGVTVRNDRTGVTVANTPFFVNSKGQISASASSTGAGLPKTGNDVGGLVKAGAALVAVGGLVVLATKRRKAASAA